MAHVVIVGLGPGGQFAVKGVADHDRRAKLTILEKRPYDAFSPCSLPLVIEGLIPSVEDIKFPVQAPRNAEKVLQANVVSIHPSEHMVKVDVDGEMRDVQYDGLVLALGSTPRQLPIPGLHEHAGRGVHFMYTPEDTHAMIERVGGKSAGTVAVLGAGPLGLEGAWALREKGWNVHVFEMLPSVIPRFGDARVSGEVQKYLEGHGIVVHLETSLDAVLGDGDTVTGVRFGEKELTVDMVLSGAGSVPNTKLAEDAGIEVTRQGIVVDDHMRTSVPDVYAVGDCVGCRHFMTGEVFQPLLATPAYKQGIVAGANAAGGDRVYEGSLATFVTVFGDMEISSTGLSEDMAKTHGKDVVSVSVKTPAKPHYLVPEGPDIHVRLVVEKDTGLVLGAQAMGPGASYRVNVVALAITKGCVIEDLSDTELAYCPPVQELYDVLNVCADVIRKRLGR